MVGRQLRSLLDGLGHETFILARPSRDQAARPSYIDRSGVWQQPHVTEASSYEIPLREYQSWAEANSLDVAFFDQNYQFEEIATLRRMGVKTLGRFVWESFAPTDAEPALRAFDLIYSLTECEQERYRTLEINSPKVDWGCHPELLAVTPERDREIVRFIYPGGFMSKRKPFEAVIEAFTRSTESRFRLVFKAQVERQARKVRKLVRKDPRIEVIWEDLPTDRYLQLFANCHVCLAPSRWEGLGLHLYEATAFGMPIVTNDNPPMNEMVEDGVNGLLVRGIETGKARSGIPAFDPDIGELAAAILRFGDERFLEELYTGALQIREQRRWEKTVTGYSRLLERITVPKETVSV